MSQHLGQASDFGIRDALRTAIDALGGYKKVGAWLHPEDHPETAGEWLSHCLTRGRRDRLSLDQIAAIFRRAHDQGAHTGMDRLCAAFGYAPAAPISERDVIADLQRQVLAQAQAVTSLSAELTERMKHAGLKVES